MVLDRAVRAVGRQRERGDDELEGVDNAPFDTYPPIIAIYGGCIAAINAIALLSVGERIFQTLLIGWRRLFVEC